MSKLCRPLVRLLGPNAGCPGQQRRVLWMMGPEPQQARRRGPRTLTPARRICCLQLSRPSAGEASRALIFSPVLLWGRRLPMDGSSNDEPRTRPTPATRLSLRPKARRARPSGRSCVVPPPAPGMCLRLLWDTATSAAIDQHGGTEVARAASKANLLSRMRAASTRGARPEEGRLWTPGWEGEGWGGSGSGP